MLKVHGKHDAGSVVQGERTRQVHALLSHLLERGELGHPLPPERYLAVMFSCSRVTIRRVLAAHEGVSRERGRGTFAFRGPPIVGAEDLLAIAKKQQVVALLSDHPGEEFNTALAPFYYSLFLALCDAEPSTRFVIARCDEVIAESKRLLQTRGFNGFVAPGYQWSSQTFEAAYRSGSPFVAVGRNALDLYWNIVELSWELEVAAAIAEMRIKPADRVLFLGQKYNDVLDEQVLHSLYLQHLNAQGVPADNIHYGEGGVFETDGYFAAKRYLAKHGVPTVVIANGDLAAAGAYRALHDRLDGKLQIGRDVRILGAGNFMITEYLNPPLSTFDFNRPELAKAILNMLAEQKSGRRLVGLRHVPVSYISRKSTVAQ
jgi:DNA-binding LacI/PurR family transcriptional regulator